MTASPAYVLTSGPSGPLSLEPSGGQLAQFLAPLVVTLSVAAGNILNSNIVIDASLGNVYAVTLTSSSWTFLNPVNGTDGQVIRIRLTQDGAGSRTVAWGTAYDWGTGNNAPALAGAASKTDILAFEYVAALSKWCSLGAAFPQGY